MTCSIDRHDDLSGLSREPFCSGGGEIHSGNAHFNKLEDVDSGFDLVINCAGIGAKSLGADRDWSHIADRLRSFPRLDLAHAVVCDDAPLTYAIPRANDCVFGGTNELSDDRAADPAATAQIVAECSRVLGIPRPKVLAARVGLRPFRKTGVRLERVACPTGAPSFIITATAAPASPCRGAARGRRSTLAKRISPNESRLRFLVIIEKIAMGTHSMFTKVEGYAP